MTTLTDQTNERSVRGANLEPCWWTDLENLRVLLLYLVDDCVDRDERRQVIGWVLSEPWKYEDKYLEAVEAERDGK